MLDRVHIWWMLWWFINRGMFTNWTGAICFTGNPELGVIVACQPWSDRSHNHVMYMNMVSLYEPALSVAMFGSSTHLHLGKMAAILEDNFKAFSFNQWWQPMMTKFGDAYMRHWVWGVWVWVCGCGCVVVVVVVVVVVGGGGGFTSSVTRFLVAYPIHTFSL